MSCKYRSLPWQDPVLNGGFTTACSLERVNVLTTRLPHCLHINMSNLVHTSFSTFGVTLCVFTDGASFSGVSIGHAFLDFFVGVDIAY